MWVPTPVYSRDCILHLNLSVIHLSFITLTLQTDLQMTIVIQFITHPLVIVIIWHISIRYLFFPWINDLNVPFCVVPFCVVAYCAVAFNATLFFCTQIACQRQLANHVIILRLPQLSLEGNIAQALYKRDSKVQYQQIPNFFSLNFHSSHIIFHNLENPLS